MDEVKFTIRENPLSFNRSPQKALKESLENDSNLPIKVNQKLAKPDILIIEARESLKKKRSETDSRYVGLNYGRYKGVVETKSNDSWMSFEYQPSGIPAFKLESYPYREWKDGQRCKREITMLVFGK